MICSYHSGSEVTKLYNSSGNVIFHGYDDGDGNKWYDDNGNLLKRQGIEDDPYAQTSWLTSTFYPDGQIKSKTYSSQSSSVREEFDEKGNLTYMYDKPPSAPAYEHYFLLDDCNITFSRVTLNEHEFLTGGYVNEDNIHDLEEFQEYYERLKEYDDDSISVITEHFVAGESGHESEPATAEQLAYLESHDLCDALLLEKNSFSVYIDREEDCDFEM